MIEPAHSPNSTCPRRSATFLPSSAGSGAPAAGFLIEARGYGPSFLALAAVQVLGAVVYAAWDRTPVAPPTI